jgi:hypothetical protein
MPSASVSPRVLEVSYLSLKPGDDPNGWSPKVSFVTRVGDLGCGVHRFGRDSSTQPVSKSCGMNSRTLNGLPSDRSFRTSRVAFPVLTTGAS